MPIRRFTTSLFSDKKEFSVMSGRAFASVPASATGGTKTTSGGYTLHTFSTTGSFTFSINGNLDVEYLILSGGGSGGGYYYNAGGGGGGLVSSTTNIKSGETSVEVGAGGVGEGTLYSGNNGGSSSIGSISMNGGKYGGEIAVKVGGTSGNGNSGSDPYQGGGGGGGAGAAATNTKNGGSGLSSSLSGSSVTYGGGGGGAPQLNEQYTNFGTGGSGGGGNGANSGTNATSGTNGLGGGGGGACTNVQTAGSGGRGLVIIRYLSDSTVSGYTYN